ncbi:ATP-binding protein [Sandarakinorhabdus sp. DWP1-3-1]|uniref:ATP-binding protein n=1 Tax=Sandarakinorhabdus sp. DWP1-3-1 TaxID=2804627 RepID=UPI003CEE6813
MIEYLQKLLGQSGLAPHGVCLLWDPALIWTHVVADAATGLAYFSIPFAMAVFLTRRPDIRFRAVAWLFVAFIIACGATHFLSIWTLWNPDYGPEALVKLVTAVISVATAVMLWPLLPRALALPSPQMLQQANDDLMLRIAERDAALDALHTANATRERAEAMLAQAQKMESLGQLTGGIAHDFNNLLTIVVANVDRARRFGSDNPRIVGALDAAQNGADRAARLTDQLLSFARRQPLQPERHDLNAIVEDSMALFGRTLDPSIRLQIELAPDLWPVCIDQGQCENAVLNLIVNARDAMPDGGTLTIRTANIDGEAAVELQVIDTGTGMLPDVVARAFEPFFTTKAIGRGSGLGLSQVYGFASQSGGEVDIISTPEAGTTVSLRLPGAEQSLERT